ncbi:hypothetical protein AB0N20_27515 [Streptomyces griseoincarnatus]
MSFRTMTPGERWVRRVMGNLGARPVGHAEQSGEDATAPAAPVVPLQTAPAPDWPPAGRRISTSSAPGSLPAPGQTIDLTARPADGDHEEPDDRDDRGEPDDGEDPRAVRQDSEADGRRRTREDDAEGEVDGEEPLAKRAGPGRISKVPQQKGSIKAGKGRKGGGSGDGSLKDDPNFRTAVFNLTAAGLGYGLSLAPVVESYLIAAEQAARGVFELIFAVVGCVVAWRLFSHPAVSQILPASIRGVPTPLILWKAAAAAGAAQLAKGQAPAAVDWLNSHGQRWGLGPNAVSFVLVSGGIALALWWFIDRKARRFHWTTRWLLRVPLATAVVVTLRSGVPFD